MLYSLLVLYFTDSPHWLRSTHAHLYKHTRELSIIGAIGNTELVVLAHFIQGIDTFTYPASPLCLKLFIHLLLHFLTRLLLSAGLGFLIGSKASQCVYNLSMFVSIDI